MDQISRAAHIIGNDDSASASHRLIHDQSPRLMLGRQDKDGSQIEEARQLALVAESCKAHIPAMPCSSRLLAENCHLIAISHDEQVRTRTTAHAVAKLLKGLQQVIAMLAFLQL